MARSEGFEPPIFRIGICCVIHLRHERNCRSIIAQLCENFNLFFRIICEE